MNFEEWYLLDVIDQLTWNEVAIKYNENGMEKITSYQLEEIIGWDKVKLRLHLIKLRNRKLISNGTAFTGFNVGWFATVRGHKVAVYKRSMIKE